MKKIIKRVLSLVLILCFTATIFTGFRSEAAGFNKKTATKNIKATYKVMDDGILATFKNKNAYAVTLKATINFVDADGQSIGKETFVDKCFPKKKTMVYFFKTPTIDDGSPKKYSNYSIKFKVGKAAGKDYTGKIKINYNIEPTVTKCTAMNLAPANLTSINATFVFYDGSNNIIAIRNVYLNCRKSNTAYDFTLTHVGLGTPAKMKIYMNWAY